MFQSSVAVLDLLLNRTGIHGLDFMRDRQSVVEKSTEYFFVFVFAFVSTGMTNL